MKWLLVDPLPKQSLSNSVRTSTQCINHTNLLHVAYAKKKSSNQFHYVDVKGDLLATCSPCSNCLNFLSEVFNAISNKSLFDFDHDHLQLLIRTLCRTINDRISSLWNIREVKEYKAIIIGFLHKEIQMLSVVLGNIHSILISHEFIMCLIRERESPHRNESNLSTGNKKERNHSTGNEFMNMQLFNRSMVEKSSSSSTRLGRYDRLLDTYGLVHHCLNHQVPLFQHRLNAFTHYVVKFNCQEILREYFVTRADEFLVLSHQRNCCLLLPGGCGRRTRGTRRNTSIGPDGTQKVIADNDSTAEAEIYLILRKGCVESLHKGLARVLSVATHVSDDLNKNNNNNADNSSSSNTSDCNLHRALQHYTSLVVNTTLETFLQYLVDETLLFDESGVYKLFRIVLKLQEYVSDLKKGCDVQPGEKLIKDTRPWEKAEAILQILNAAIFSVKCASASTVRGSMEQASDTATEDASGIGAGGGGGGGCVGGNSNSRIPTSSSPSPRNSSQPAATGTSPGAGTGTVNLPVVPTSAGKDASVVAATSVVAAGMVNSSAEVDVPVEELLTKEEQQRWKDLATSTSLHRRHRHRRNYNGYYQAQLSAGAGSGTRDTTTIGMGSSKFFRGFVLWRRKHSGTVFVALQIDTTNL